MTDDRLPNIVLFYQLSRAKQKAGYPRKWWKDFVRKDLLGEKQKIFENKQKVVL
jgi:hypothetical protein